MTYRLFYTFNLAPGSHLFVTYQTPVVFQSHTVNTANLSTSIGLWNDALTYCGATGNVTAMTYNSVTEKLTVVVTYSVSDALDPRPVYTEQLNALFAVVTTAYYLPYVIDTTSAGGNYFNFYLDGVEVVNPMDWEEMKIVIERDQVLNGLFTNYIDKLTFTGDGYIYIKDQIDLNNFCGEIDFEVVEHANGSKTAGGFSYSGIIDLSNVSLNRSQCKAKASIEDNSLAWLVKKYKDLKIVINAQELTLNGEALAKIGVLLTPAYSYVPGVTALAAAYYSDAIQYLLDYITDNRITLTSGLLETDEFKPHYTTLTFTALGGADTSVITYKNFYGELITWSTTGVKTAPVHAREFTVDNNYNLPTDGNTKQEDFSELVFIRHDVNGVTGVVEVVTLWDPEFTLNGFVSQVVTDNYADGAANVAYTTPFNIQTAAALDATDGLYGELSFLDLYNEIRKTWCAEMSIKKVAGVNSCLIEKRVDFMNTLNTSLTITDVDSIEETIADDLLTKAFNYSQKSENEPFYVFKKVSYSFNNCGIKDYLCDLQFYYGDHIHKQIISEQLTDLSILPFRVISPTQQAGVIATEYQASGNILYQDRFLIGEFATHPLVVKRHLEVVQASATAAGKTITNENSLNIKKLNTFNYPLCWSEMKSMVDTPDYYINVSTDSLIKKTYIKKVEYKVLTGATKFQLYSS